MSRDWEPRHSRDRPRPPPSTDEASDAEVTAEADAVSAQPAEPGRRSVALARATPRRRAGRGRSHPRSAPPHRRRLRQLPKANAARARRRGQEARPGTARSRTSCPSSTTSSAQRVHAEAATEAKAVADGLRIVLKQFLDTLEKLGVKRVVAVGQPFDPSVHEAIQQLESAEHLRPASSMAEVQPGYSLGDRLIRAALVVVSKGQGPELRRPRFGKPGAIVERLAEG